MRKSEAKKLLSTMRCRCSRWIEDPKRMRVTDDEFVEVCPMCHRSRHVLFVPNGSAPGSYRLRISQWT